MVGVSAIADAETGNDETKITELHCDITRTRSSNIPASITFASTATDVPDPMAGISTDNVSIFNGLDANRKDAVENELLSMDLCLQHSQQFGVWHMHMLGPCGKVSSKTTTPILCEDDDNCKDMETTFTEITLPAFTSTASNGGVVGLAKDGHVIVGPYNEAGELWSCDDVDVCNGAFLDSDKSYVYASTPFFPYFVGCYGPGPQQTVSATCTTNGCGAVAGLVEASFALAALLLAINF